VEYCINNEKHTHIVTYFNVGSVDIPVIAQIYNCVII